MKPIYLSVQATYVHASIALFSRDICLKMLSVQEVRASSHLILFFDCLLKEYSHTIEHVDFIAIDKGPGAFTSLRVAIATVNGIAYAKKIPLIGISSLEALASQSFLDTKANNLPANSHVLVLLNAYNNDVYYLFAKHAIQNTELLKIEEGCKKIDLVLQRIQEYSLASLVITGNAVEMHQQLINESLGSIVHLYHYQQQTPNAKTIGLMAFRELNKTTVCKYKIEPLYMKSGYYAIKGRVQ